MSSIQLYDTMFLIKHDFGNVLKVNLDLNQFPLFQSSFVQKVDDGDLLRLFSSNTITQTYILKVAHSNEGDVIVLFFPLPGSLGNNYFQ